MGCAAGFFLAEAKAFYEVQGVELSDWSSAYARDRLGLDVFTGTLQQGDQALQDGSLGDDYTLNLTAGQPVTIVADVLPNHTFKGHVASLALASLATLASTQWSYRHADASVDAIWPQVLATAVSSSTHSLVRCSSLRPYTALLPR